MGLQAALVPPHPPMPLLLSVPPAMVLRLGQLAGLQLHSSPDFQQRPVTQPAHLPSPPQPTARVIAGSAAGLVAIQTLRSGALCCGAKAVQSRWVRLRQLWPLVGSCCRLNLLVVKKVNSKVRACLRGQCVPD